MATLRPIFSLSIIGMIDGMQCDIWAAKLAAHARVLVHA